MYMLDLFSGLGGASQFMKESGWEVITVDKNPDFNPDIIADISTYHHSGPVPDLVWASPPCTEFSRRSLPITWACNRGKHQEPDLSLALATMRIIQEINPRWWVVENVRGAVPFLIPIFGPVMKRCGSRYLWGKFPICDPSPGYGKFRLPPSKDRAAIRALIPRQISQAIAQAIEVSINR